MISSLSHTTCRLVLFILFLGNYVASIKIPKEDLSGVPPFNVTQKSLVKFLKLRDTVKFKVPALYVFGDSTVDSGNNDFFQPQSINAKYSPYGVDFGDGKPNGRYTNGRTEADFIGLSDMENKTLRTGVNYASGGCGILSAGKNSLGSCLPFYKQIDYFEITIKNLKKRFRSKERLAHYLSKSLLFIDIGNVDMSNDYDGFGSTIYLKYTVRQYAQIVSKEFFKSLKRLYKLGARKFLVNNLGAIGCIPALEIGPIHKTLCAKKANMRAIEYNKILSKMLPKVQSSLPGSKIALGDAYKVLMDAVTFPALYGYSARKSINVAIGNKVFSAVVEEDEQVSHQWLSSLLGLVECKSSLKQGETGFDARVDSSSRGRVGIDRMEAKVYHDWQVVGEKPAKKSFRPDKGECKKDGIGVSFRLDRQECHKKGKSGFLDFENREYMVSRKGELKGRSEKGKERMPQKTRGRRSPPLGNGKLIIGEGTLESGWEALAARHRIQTLKRRDFQIFIGRKESARKSSKWPSSNSGSAYSEPTTGENGSLMLDQVQNTGGIQAEGLSIGDPNSYMGLSKVITNEEQRIEEAASLTIAPSVRTPTLSKAKIGGKRKGVTKSHTMQTRWSNKINQDKGKDGETDRSEKWNLEVEVTKMVEEGYARGFFSKPSGDGTCGSKIDDAKLEPDPQNHVGPRWHRPVILSLPREGGSRCSVKPASRCALLSRIHVAPEPSQESHEPTLSLKRASQS
ncbi:hypothetical protein EZV62_005541 [Acer yangbiense]|uniref:GDSL esterase/lipase n=1 Tax=Acer yangbiense TaxID=1000413 RepID=A0A5C7IQ69_9ROSI|nr:hypothetical protein EZV62_005541 [Acer yangbiense]